MTSPATDIHGPALVGILLSTLLLGICLLQTAQYYSAYNKDPLWLKIYARVLKLLTEIDRLNGDFQVAALALANTLQTAFSCYWIYNSLVTNFMNVEALQVLTWPLASDPAMVGVIAFSVQAFFAWRIKVITGKTLLSMSILFCSFITLVGGIAVAVRLRYLDDFRGWTVQRVESILTEVWLVPAALADLAITISLPWHLRQKRTGIAKTDSAIQKIIRLTIRNGALSTIFALLDTITFLALPRWGLHLGFSFPLPKLYTNSVLSSLNARDPSRHSAFSDGSKDEPSKDVPNELFVSVNVQKTIHADDWHQQSSVQSIKMGPIDAK
ncbi:hypothetical protein PLICRDRAFT_699908 [Plicaturopsis crispa FD-325 SS-3]|nr:hypothetical protein PLICRDRAFT_699908 [Plicaturopsis crispa FD-325 SS-3]